MKKKTIAFKTLGCRLNQFETEALASKFQKENFEIVNFSSPADIYVVNSCTVTNQSDRKTRNYVEQAHKKNKNSVMVVMGCISPNQRELLQKKPHVTYLVDNKKKSAVFQLVDAHFKGEIISPEALTQNNFDYAVTDKLFHTRGFLKIQDGCDNFCTFCIIPFVRGRAISRSMDEILTNAREYIAKGYKELVITGVNIGRYQFEQFTFEDVLEKVLDLPGDFRIRISSLEPEGIGEKYLKLLSHPKLTPHLHLCLQSGSEKVLIRMKRMYSYQQFKELVEKIRQVQPAINLTTDIMVGFPGETHEEFQETVNAIHELAFSHIHTFKYSVRTGTRAERMTEQTPENVKTERSQEVIKLSTQQKMDYYQSFIGKESLVLIEKKLTGAWFSGYNEYYMPVRCKADHDVRDTFVQVKITDINHEEESLLGELI